MENRSVLEGNNFWQENLKIGYNGKTFDSWRISLKRYLRDYGFLFLLSGIIIVADQATKAWVRASLPIGGSWAPWEWLAPYARIVHWYNTGVAFGMFQGLGDVFKVMALVVAAAIIYYYPRVPESDWALRVAMGMQLAGALGNWIDRMTIGHVTDFISVGNFPVFNVADSSITLGVVVLFIGMIIEERKEKRRAQNGLETEEGIDVQSTEAASSDFSDAGSEGTR